MRKSFQKKTGALVYYIQWGMRRLIRDSGTLKATFGLRASDLDLVSDSIINGINPWADFPVIRSKLIKGSGPKTYLIEKGRRRLIIDSETLAVESIMNNICLLKETELRGIPEGEPWGINDIAA